MPVQDGAGKDVRDEGRARRHDDSRDAPAGWPPTMGETRRMDETGEIDVFFLMRHIINNVEYGRQMTPLIYSDR